MTVQDEDEATGRVRDAKRARLDVTDGQQAPVDGLVKSTSVQTVFSPHLFQDTTRNGLRDLYGNAKVYPHCHMRDVMRPEFFRELRDEMIGNLTSTFKETDLFKLYQTGDLANLDPNDREMAARLPRLMALRDAIYSPEFRDLVSEVAGCPGALVDRTDCSSNLYMQGGHLLCHDDVIGTRKVSFIIYLTDPDEEWTEEDGGALELYPLVDPHKLGEPAVAPMASYLPLPNSMAFFTVLPGRSFHAVEEVYQEGKMRLSISGWYHGSEPPEGSDLASLTQLQTRGTERLEWALGPASAAEADAAVLKGWVNPTYLSDSAMTQIRGRFAEDGSVLLYGFLKPSIADAIASATRRRDEAEGVGDMRKLKHSTGCDGRWEPVGPPHKQRYLRVGSEGQCEAGQLLVRLRDELMASGAFARLLHKLTGVEVARHRAEARRFRPGLDYTLAHYGLLTPEPRLDASLCFVDDGGEHSEAWSSGDVGGFMCYIKADEGNDGAEAAESYKAHHKDTSEEDVLSVFAANNALSLVLRQKSAMRFVKYVSAAAPGSRWDVAAEYEIAGEGQKINGDHA